MFISDFLYYEYTRQANPDQDVTKFDTWGGDYMVDFWFEMGSNNVVKEGAASHQERDDFTIFHMTDNKTEKGYEQSKIPLIKVNPDHCVVGYNDCGNSPRYVT